MCHVLLFCLKILVAQLNWFSFGWIRFSLWIDSLKLREDNLIVVAKIRFRNIKKLKLYQSIHTTLMCHVLLFCLKILVAQLNWFSFGWIRFSLWIDSWKLREENLIVVALIRFRNLKKCQTLSIDSHDPYVPCFTILLESSSFKIERTFFWLKQISNSNRFVKAT